MIRTVVIWRRVLPVLCAGALGLAAAAAWSAPQLLRVSYLGGSAEDAGRAVARAAGGVTWIGGYTLSPDCPVTAGASWSGGTSFGDVFLARFGPTGTAPVVCLLGGTGDDRCLAMAAAPDGGVYACGITNSADFPATAVLGSRGGDDAWVARFNAQGQLQWCLVAGGDQADAMTALCLDGDTLLLTGYTESTAFPTTPGVLVGQRYADAGDAFILRVRANGQPIWSTLLPGEGGRDEGWAISRTSEGKVLCAGMTQSTGFTMTADAWRPERPSTLSEDIFVVILSADGASLDYGTWSGGRGVDVPCFVAEDALGRIVLAGSTESNNLPVTDDATQKKLGGGRDAFVQVIDRAGKALAYGTYLGGSGADDCRGGTLRPNGDLWLVGRTKSAAFPQADPWVASKPGDADGWIGCIRLASHALRCCSWYGGLHADDASAISAGVDGYLSVTGQSLSADIPLVSPWQANLADPTGDAWWMEIDPDEPRGVVECRVVCQRLADSAPPPLVTIEARACGMPGTVLASAVATPDAEGWCRVSLSATGLVDLAVNAAHFLRTVAPDCLLGVEPWTGAVALINGDADGDNAITLFDYLVLDGAFGTASPMADLDGDGSVTLFDYLVIDASFGAVGSL